MAAPAGIAIAPLPRRLVQPLASLYAAACADNPAYSAIFLLDGERKARTLEWFFERRLALLLARGAFVLVAVDEASGAVVGGVGLVPPASRPRLADKLAVAAAWLCAWGLPSFLRLLELDRLASSGLVCGGELELVMMAVAEERRGAGVGGALVREALRLAGAGSRIRLATNKIHNVRYYERFHFGVISRQEIKLSDPRCGAFSQWVMEVVAH